MTQKIAEYTKEIIAALSGYFVYLAGGFGQALEFLAWLLLIDYITGVMKAVILNEVNSTIGLIGIIKKAGVLIIVVIVNMVDIRLGVSGQLRESIIYMLFINECISSLENLGAINVPGAKQVSQTIDQIREVIKD